MAHSDELTPPEALRRLQRIHPHHWAGPGWHARRIAKYTAKLKAHFRGEAVDCVRQARLCQQDAEQTDYKYFVFVYRLLGRLFEWAAGADDGKP